MMDLTGKNLRVLRPDRKGEDVTVLGDLGPGLLLVSGDAGFQVINLYGLDTEVYVYDVVPAAGNPVEQKAARHLANRLPMSLSKVCDRLAKFDLLPGQTQATQYAAWRHTFLGIEAGLLESAVFAVEPYTPASGGRSGYRVKFRQAEGTAVEPKWGADQTLCRREP